MSSSRTADALTNDEIANGRGTGSGEQINELRVSEGIRAGSVAAIESAEKRIDAHFQAVGGERYEPDLSVYKPDRANDKRSRYHESLRSINPPPCTISVQAKDGRTERISLKGFENKAFHEGSVEDRRAFIDMRIREGRWTVARRGINKLTEATSRLREGEQLNLSATLTPDEEAFLRGFGLLETVQEREPRPEGGYNLREVDHIAPAAAFDRARLCESVEDLRKLREDGVFTGVGSLSPPAFGFGGGSAPYLDNEFLPSWGYGTAQQLFITDIWDELAKVEFAYRHDPLAKKAVHTIRDFTLGRGVEVRCKDPKLQEFVDEFWERNRMQQRLKDFAISSSKSGEIFLRMFPTGDGRSSVRRLRPDAIWEIVTDAEDFEKVFYYVEMYMTRIQVFTADAPAAADPHYVRREIDAHYVIHRKLNAEDTEIRGRSDLYAGLGWFKRMRDLLDTVVQKEQALAAYWWDYTVDGGKGDVDRVVASLPKGKVDPGSSHVHNTKVTAQAVQSGARGSQGQGTPYENLLNHCAIAVEVPREYFGSGSRSTRANTFVAEAPTQKRFEERQDWLSDVIHAMLDWAITEAKKSGLLEGIKDLAYRVVFPAILRADAKERQGLIMSARAAGHISNKTAAELVYAELDLEDVDYDEEVKQIKKELEDETGVEAALPKANEQIFTASFTRKHATEGSGPEGGAVGPALAVKKDGASATDMGIAVPTNGKAGGGQAEGAPAPNSQTSDASGGGGADAEAAARGQG